MLTLSLVSFLFAGCTQEDKVSEAPVMPTPSVNAEPVAQVSLNGQEGFEIDEVNDGVYFNYKNGYSFEYDETFFDSVSTKHRAYYEAVMTQGGSPQFSPIKISVYTRHKDDDLGLGQDTLDNLKPYKGNQKILHYGPTEQEFSSTYSNFEGDFSYGQVLYLKRSDGDKVTIVHVGGELEAERNGDGTLIVKFPNKDGVDATIEKIVNTFQEI